MFELVPSKRFKKTLKKLLCDQQFQIAKLEEVFERLEKGISLEKHHRNHKLKGEFEGYYECHSQPDILIMYEVDEVKKIIYLFKIGSHSELF